STDPGGRVGFGQRRERIAADALRQRRRPVTPRDRASRRLYGVLAFLVLCLPAGGCASFWDEVFSRERDLDGYFRPPDAMTVIDKCPDGERRAKALASLREPAQNGGSPQEQERYLLILATVAKTDRDPFCRLGAIKAMGHFKDPRAAVALREVFEQTVKL